MMESSEGAKAAFEIVKTIVLAATPVRVWNALTDPEELERWFPDEKADVEVRPGAEGAWIWENHGSYAVRFEVVEPHRRLVWSWARDRDTPLGETPVSRVEFRLEENADGGTTLHLRESGFETEEHLEGNDRGWDKELGHLADYLEGEGAG